MNADQPAVEPALSWDVQATGEEAPVGEEAATEYVEAATVEQLREDVDELMSAMRRIQNIDPASIPGGPNNQSFGAKGMQAFTQAKETALKAMIAQTKREVTREYGIPA